MAVSAGWAGPTSDERETERAASVTRAPAAQQRVPSRPLPVLPRRGGTPRGEAAHRRRPANQSGRAARAPPANRRPRPRASANGRPRPSDRERRPTVENGHDVVCILMGRQLAPRLVLRGNRGALLSLRRPRGGRHSHSPPPTSRNTRYSPLCTERGGQPPRVWAPKKQRGRGGSDTGAGRSNDAPTPRFPTCALSLSVYKSRTPEPGYGRVHFNIAMQPDPLALLLFSLAFLKKPTPDKTVAALSGRKTQPYLQCKGA